MSNNLNQEGGDGYRLELNETVGGQSVVNSYQDNCSANDSNVNEQTGAGYNLDLEKTVGGQAEINSYDDASLADYKMTGGGAYEFIFDPVNGEKYSIFSKKGKSLLKKMVKFIRKQE